MELSAPPLVGFAMRMIMIVIAVVFVVSAVLWAYGKTAGAPDRAGQAQSGNANGTPFFDTPNLFSHVKGDAGSVNNDGDDTHKNGNSQPSSGENSPYERKTERLENAKNMMEAEDELHQQQISAPYEAEIERLEQERRLLEAQQKLDEQKAAMQPEPPPILPEKMPRPVTDF